MRSISFILGLVVLAAMSAVVHYYAPRSQVVRIVGTEVIREEAAVRNPDDNTPELQIRDVRQINTVEAHEDEVSVYRNTDAWGYFKFDSADIAAQADNLTSSREDPRWVVITAYGWRIRILSMFPNVIRLNEVEDPEQTLIPWKWVAVGIFVLIVLVLRRLILLSIARYQDPAFDD